MHRKKNRYCTQSRFKPISKLVAQSKGLMSSHKTVFVNINLIQVSPSGIAQWVALCETQEVLVLNPTDADTDTSQSRANKAAHSG